MPVLDGLSATLRLRGSRATRDIPVIAFSAESAETHREVALAAGCRDYLAKPPDLDQLNEILNRYFYR